MFISNSFTINSKGHLCIGGADAVSLAARHGTPLYVMDENAIRKNLRDFMSSISKSYAPGGMVAYASKAFSCKEIYRLLKEEGAGTDVVSGGELFTVLEAGFPPEKIIFHGNNKTTEELSFAVRSGVGRVVVDNLRELDILGGISRAAGKKTKIMLRVKPGVDAHTHTYIQTGQIDSKFGLAVETGEAMDAAKIALETNGLELTGLHCHIGSQIFETDPFCLAAEVLLKLMADVKHETGHELSELNLGGGFGIKYVEGHDPKPYGSYIEKVSSVIRDFCEKNNFRLPFIIIEPGRSIVGPAGATLYTVGAIKTIPNIRTYVAVDGGMTDNPRYALYKSEYDVVIAGKASKPRSDVATVAGRCCETGDLLGEGFRIQKTEPSDVLAVLATGAYNYSMASNYNRLPRPPVVFVKDGADRVVIRRESYEDLVKNDI